MLETRVNWRGQPDFQMVEIPGLTNNNLFQQINTIPISPGFLTRNETLITRNTNVDNSTLDQSPR